MDGLKAKLSIVDNISAVIDELQDFYINGKVKPTDSYMDSYEVDSSFDDVVVNTKNKYLRDNIIVKKIPVHAASNDSGGYTLNIGG